MCSTNLEALSKARFMLTSCPQHPRTKKEQISDGSSNQQRSGVGVILKGPNGLLIEQALWFAFKASNNQAKYEALIAGMLLAKEMGANSLITKSNSLLVTGQVTREY